MTPSEMIKQIIEDTIKSLQENDAKENDKSFGKNKIDLELDKAIKK